MLIKPLGLLRADAAAAPSGNLMPDPGFDNASAWVTATGMSVAGGVLSLDGTNVSNGSISQASNYFIPVPDDTATYDFQFEVTRYVNTGTSRLRFEPLCYDGPTVADVNLGSTVPGRVGTPEPVPVTATGTFGPFSFTVLAGTTHVRWRIKAVDASMDMDLDNFSIVQV